jgi:hypothetical protein
MTTAHILYEHLQQFEEVREKINDLKPQLYWLIQMITTTNIDGDPEEVRQRVELVRYVCNHLPCPSLSTASAVLWKR